MVSKATGAFSCFPSVTTISILYNYVNSTVVDGGGIRGLSSLIILKEVLYRLQIRSNLDDIPRPCDLFDLAGGTGTGG